MRALGARDVAEVVDPRDSQIHTFLVDLAVALATLPDDQIHTAASLDATYADTRIDYSNVLDFGSWSTDIYADNLSFAATERFHKFLPESAQLQAGEKLYLYASFLGRRVDAA